jgi:poly(A) polymerase
MTDAQNRVVLYQLGEVRFKDLVLLGWAADSTADNAGWNTLKGLPDRMPIPEFSLEGEDVLDLGIDPGKIVGELLSEAERWWIDKDFRPNRAACLEQLRNVAHRIK